MGARLCRMGMTWSSSAPSVTRMNASAGNFSSTASSCSLTLLSDSKLALLCPVSTTISTFSNCVFSSSYFLTVANMALASVSPGSARASLAAALRQAFRPITGPWMPVFLPRSSSRSTERMSMLLCCAMAFHRLTAGKYYIEEARILIYCPPKGFIRHLTQEAMVLAEAHGHGGGHGGYGGHGGHEGPGSRAKPSKSKETVFVGLLLIGAAFVLLLFFNQGFLSQNLGLILAAALVIYLFARFDFLLTLKDYERAVISRFGRVNRVGGPGWALLLPPIESYEKVELRTQIIDIPKQDVVTKDGVEVKIAAVIYIKVRNEPRSIINSIIKVEDYKRDRKSTRLNS